MDRNESILTAKANGAKAHNLGIPVEANPYKNIAGGRVYYRAWRSGWYSAQNLENTNAHA